MGDIGLRELYFGSVDTCLVPVAGRSVIFDAKDWAEDRSVPGILTVLNRSRGENSHPCTATAEKVVVPALPALDFVFVGCETPESQQFTTTIPKTLHQPLLKVPVTSSAVGGIMGVASGVRSALLNIDGEWFRLKGCGNNESGFIVRSSTAADGRKWVDIRGSAFAHTAVRELKMTALLADALREEGVECCNNSVAMFLYDSKELLPLGPQYPTACVVTRTLGDRRFGSHVLAGLMILLPLLIDDGALCAADLLSAFPANRPRSESGNGVVSTAELMTDHMLGTANLSPAERIAVHGLQWADCPRDATSLLSLVTADYCCVLGRSERSPLGSASSSSPPSQWTPQGPRPMDARWASTWTALTAEYARALQCIAARSQQTNSVLFPVHCGGASSDSSASRPGLSSVLVYLFSRCGFDAGRVLRGMHSRRVSWGTYQDEMCRVDLDEWHCNAHSNNLVVLPEGEGRQSLLCFLDLDMAFSESGLVDVSGRVPAAAATVVDESSGVAFDQLLWREHVNFMEVLSGSDSSSGVPKVAQSFVTSTHNDVLQLLSSALLDTMILSYMCGYTAGGKTDNFEHVAAFDAELHHAAHCLMRLCIAVMANYIA
jgi:hypothetical protein